MKIRRPKLKVLRFAFVGMLVVAATGSRTCLGDTVVEDFFDGDPTDGSPLEWLLDNPEGSGSIVDGAFRLDGSSSMCCPGIYTIIDEYTDIRIENSVQFLSDANMFASIVFRGLDDVVADAYWAGVQGDGELGIGYAQGGNIITTARGVFLPRGTVHKDARITFRVDAIGNMISLSAWESEEDIETATLLEWTDSEDLFPFGNVVQAAFHPYGKTTKYASLHDLRRSFGNRWAPRVMPSTLKLLMRHESIETTMKYYVDQSAEDAAELRWQAMPDSDPLANTFANSGHNSLPEQLDSLDGTAYSTRS